METNERRVNILNSANALKLKAKRVCIVLVVDFYFVDLKVSPNRLADCVSIFVTWCNWECVVSLLITSFCESNWFVFAVG